MNNKNTPKDYSELSTSDTKERTRNHEQVELKSGNTSERARHDELFKKVMSEPVAAREFLELCNDSFLCRGVTVFFAGYGGSVLLIPISLLSIVLLQF